LAASVSADADAPPLAVDVVEVDVAGVEAALDVVAEVAGAALLVLLLLEPPQAAIASATAGAARATAEILRTGLRLL
jgi:hypothetical protein